MNKPTTLGYFLKRVRDCGYRVEKLYTEYSENDPRIWTIIIDPSGASVFCTCFVNREQVGDYYFEFYDGGQYLPNYKIKTESIEVLIEQLNKYGIVHKTRYYTENGLLKSKIEAENITESDK